MVNPTPVPTLKPHYPPRDLPTGTRIVDAFAGQQYGTIGEAKFEVGNAYYYDAVVILCKDSNPGKAVISIYVKSGDKFTIHNIPSGNYFVYFMTGTDWDSDTGSFTQPQAYKKYNDAMHLTSSDAEYWIYTITLGTSSDKFPQSSVKPEDMPSLT